MPFLENAIELDTYLISDYPEVKALADHVFQELTEVDPRRVRTKNEEYRSKEALKIILVNLIIANDMEVAIRYPRRKSRYTRNSRYGRIYFKYDRVIPIIDRLVDMGYIETWPGYYNREDEIRRESRMAATENLVRLFEEHNIFALDYIGVAPPGIEELVQIRDEDGNDLEVEDRERTKRDAMVEVLARYNDYISQHEVSFHLQPETEVHAHFLNRILKRLVNKGVMKIIDLQTHGFKAIELDRREVYGFELDGREYLLMDGPGPAYTKQQLLKEHKYHISHYRNYYNRYINTILYRYNISTTINNADVNNNNINTTTLINGTLPDIDVNYKILDTKGTATAKEELKKRPLSDYGINLLSFVSRYQYLHRVFRDYLDNGGRFYGAWHINMPKGVRHCVVIDGEPACELDYKAHHIRMLYHGEDIDYREDPYEKLCQEDPSQRAVYKIVSLVAINAKSVESTVKGIRKELFDNGILFDTTDKSLKACIDKFCEIHEPISEFLNTGQWGYLQYLDSQITNHILIRMLREGVPCLPIHDSYIVPAKYEGLLHELMIEAYQKVMHGFTPVIEKEF